MPHKDGSQFHCDIDDNGDLTYPPDSPAETLGSEAMGVPAKSGSPWTDQAPSGSSAMKPSQDRHPPRRQIPKTSFFDNGTNNDSVNDDQDDQNNHIQFLRDSEPVVSAPFLNVVHPDNSVTGPTLGGGEVDEITRTAPRSGQNVFLSMTDDGEDEPTSAADKSPTPRPSRLTLSRKRTMSDASDLPVSPQIKQVAYSRQREMSEMSETQIIDKRPKKKGILHFSSAAPSMADTVDEEPPQNIIYSTQSKSGLPSHPTSHTKKKMANRRKSDLKSNANMRLSALDLEEQEEIIEEKGDPFDQANIPPSRGRSPAPSIRKPKPAPKKKAAEKVSPTGKKPAAASSKVSTRKKQAARPRQKAKPSVAKQVEGSTEISNGKDSRKNENPTDKPARPSSNRAQAKAIRTTAAASTLTQNANASGKSHSDPQKEAISISSASESRSVGTDGSDDDEYVDNSRANAVHGNSEPPKTRNKTAMYKCHNESAFSTESSGDMQIEGQDDTIQDQAQEKDGGASKCLSDKSTVDAVAPGTDRNTEIAGGQQPKKKATGIQSKSCSHPEANAVSKQQSPAGDQNGPDEIKTNSLAAEEVIQPLKKVRTMHPTKDMSKDARPVQNGSVPAVEDHSESGRPRTRLARRSQANQSGNDSTPWDPETAQSREEVKETQGLVVPSPLVSYGKLSKSAVDTKPKDRKANIISFSADGPRNNGKPKQRGSATNHQSQEPDSVVADSKPSKATKAGQKNAESSSRAFKSGTSSHEAFEPSGTRLARSLQTEQPPSLVEDQPPAVSPAVENTLPSEVYNPNSSHVSQMRTEMVLEEPEPIATEDNIHKSSPPTLAINSEKPVPRQTEIKGTFPTGDQVHANSTADLEINGTDDRLDEPNIPQSLEQPDAIDDNASDAQGSATFQNLINLELKGRVDDLKHPLAYEYASQTLVPDNEQAESYLPIDDEKHVLKHQTERHIRQSLQPAQSLPEQQSEKLHKLAMERVSALKKQPVWGRQSMSQQQMSTRKHPKEEGKYINPMSRDLEVPRHRQATHSKEHMLKEVTHSGAGEEPAKSYLQDLSVNLQRPSKKVKLDLPGSTVASPVSNINPQFCIPTNSFSSDDVFAPNEVEERRDIDDGIMNRLRGIESDKHSSEPELEAHGPIDSHIEKWHGPLHQRPSKRLAPNANHTRSVQSTTQGKFRDQNADNASGPDLWRRGLMNRYQGMAPVVQPKEQLAVEEPKLDQTIEDSMHQIVAVSFVPV